MRQPTAPIGRAMKTNVALQRPTVNIKEAENVAEQATAEANRPAPPVRFNKHGAFGDSPAHMIEKLWQD
ncbi:MAG: hypothetical protein C5B59_08545 [Bacteroidetes bacterium]|nr:MAG: hypothetical protein C5B59_08545 [Bacteroidota bacterium]